VPLTLRYLVGPCREHLAGSRLGAPSSSPLRAKRGNLHACRSNCVEIATALTRLAMERDSSPCGLFGRLRLGSTWPSPRYPRHWWTAADAPLPPPGPCREHLGGSRASAVANEIWEAPHQVHFGSHILKVAGAEGTVNRFGHAGRPNWSVMVTLEPGHRSTRDRVGLPNACSRASGFLSKMCPSTGTGSVPATADAYTPRSTFRGVPPDGAQKKPLPDGPPERGRLCLVPVARRIPGRTATSGDRQPGYPARCSTRSGCRDRAA
jgi:hypothetical protein